MGHTIRSTQLHTRGNKAYLCGLIDCNGENGERARERELTFEDCRERERERELVYASITLVRLKGAHICRLSHTPIQQIQKED